MFFIINFRSEMQWKMGVFRRLTAQWRIVLTKTFLGFFLIHSPKGLTEGNGGDWRERSFLKGKKLTEGNGSDWRERSFLKGKEVIPSRGIASQSPVAFRSRRVPWVPYVPWGPHVPPGHGAHGGPKKYILEKYFFEKKSWKKYNFLEAVNQLKKTSDCIQIHPPGPGKKLKKKSENVDHFFSYFFRGRLPAQKDKRLYPNSSPRSGKKIDKKNWIF